MCYCQPQTSKYSGAHGRWAPCPWERGEIPRQSRCCETQAHRYATDHRRSHWLKGREDGYARLSVKSEDRPVCCAQHFFGPKEVRSSPPLFMWRAASCRIIPIIRLFFLSFKPPGPGEQAAKHTAFRMCNGAAAAVPSLYPNQKGCPPCSKKGFFPCVSHC